MSLPAGTRLGPYEIVAPLGAGGMGEVYRARDGKLNRDVAIKVLPAAFASDAQYMARFEREALVLASLNHPNIATVYGIEQGALAMELVEGPDLRGPLPLEEAIPIARQIAVGLEAAHERGIVHRDLKPANIKLTPAGVVKILDFGLAKATEEAQQTTNTNSPTLSLAMTQAGMILGTAAYMSPEQARGKVVDKRADIWAFGVVFFELLTGKMLFGGGETVSDSLAAVITKEPDWSALPKDTPPHLVQLLRRCLRKDPKLRLRDIGEARIALDETEAKAGPEAVPAARRATLWPGAAAVFFLCAAAPAFVHFRESPPDRLVTRSAIQAPESHRLSPSTAAIPALSPDGRLLAFTAMADQNVSVVWVRPLDSVTARALPGTESAEGLFWSPDGKSLGFFANGKLKTTDLSGGAPALLAEVPSIVGGGYGGSWNADGTILFALQSGPILRVSAGGGAAKPVTAPKEGRRHHWPWFLPDGRHFLYIESNAAFESKIGAGSIEGGPANGRILADTSSNAVYSQGYILFLQEGRLMGLPFQPGNLTMTGTPVRISEDVTWNRRNAAGLFSASANGLLVYAGGNDANRRTLAWFNREGTRLSSAGEAGELGPFSLSPDGKNVGLTLNDGASHSEIWILELARGVRSRFTFDQAVNSNPIWSPDGNAIAFSSTRAGQNGLYRKAIDGSGVEQLLHASGRGMQPTDFSPSGKELVYHDTAGIWILPTSGDAKPVQFATQAAGPFLTGRTMDRICVVRIGAQ